jgi:hypothetical protein
MNTKKEALIVRTIHPSRGYSVTVETRDGRGHDNLGWRHRDLLSVQGAADLVASERRDLKRRGYDVEVADREASAA